MIPDCTIHTLPESGASTAESRKSPSYPDASVGSTGGPIRVLVIESCTATRGLIARTLEQSGGHQFDVDGDDPSIDALLSAPEYDVVLLGLDPPDSRGIDAYQRARNSHPSVAILILTDNPGALGGLNIGAGDYLLRAELPSGILARSIYYAVEHRRVEERLRKAHSETQHLLAAIPSILIAVGPDGRIVRWNRAAESSFGVPAKDALGRTFSELAIGWKQDDVHEIIERNHKLGDPVRLDDLVLETAEGKERTIGLSLNPLEANSHGYLLLGADVTDTRRMETQLQHSHKMEAIGQLASGVAHEINTPTQYVGDNARFLQESWAGISAFIQTFQAAVESNRDPNETLQDLKRIALDADLEYLMEEIPMALQQSLEGLDRVARIIIAMKELAYPGNGSKSRIDVNRFIESTIAVSRNEWKYVADMVTRFDEQIPRVECISGEFNQVILNLIVNAAHAIEDAAKFKPGKGRIEITTAQQKDGVEIRISDTGCGIPEEIQSRIFEPFFTTKEIGVGTGQGLAIARSVIVQNHGGSIRFESQPGEGTTFVILLPTGDGAD